MKKLLLLICFILVFGCTSKESPDNPVLAKGSGVEITKEDFIEKAGRLPEWVIYKFQDEEGKKNFLKELIKEELLYLEAKKHGLKRDKDVKKRLKQFEKKTLISALLTKEIGEKIKVDDKEVREFYDKNRDEIRVGSEIRAKHILVGTKEEAENIYKRIQKGESFSSLAKKYSKDKRSAQNGGDLGFFGKGKMAPEFEKAVRRMKTGELSKPLITRYGYHIVQITEKKTGVLPDFEKAKNGIKTLLIRTKQKSLFDSYIEDLMEMKKTKVNKDALKAITVKTKEDSQKEEELTLKPDELLNVD